MYIQQIALCQAVSRLLQFDPPQNSRDAVILRTLRIGHTCLTHQYILTREEPPQCPSYYCALTVVHILLECQQYNSVRQKYFSVTTLKELFDTVNSCDILLRDIRLYSCI